MVIVESDLRSDLTIANSFRSVDRSPRSDGRRCHRVSVRLGSQLVTRSHRADKVLHQCDEDIKQAAENSRAGFEEALNLGRRSPTFMALFTLTGAEPQWLGRAEAWARTSRGGVSVKEVDRLH